MGKIERGEHVPTLPLILKIAAALGISASELMAATEKNLNSGSEPQDSPYTAANFSYSSCRRINRPSARAGAQ